MKNDILLHDRNKFTPFTEMLKQLIKQDGAATVKTRGGMVLQVSFSCLNGDDVPDFYSDDTELFYRFHNDGSHASADRSLDIIELHVPNAVTSVADAYLGYAYYLNDQLVATFGTGCFTGMEIDKLLRAISSKKIPLNSGPLSFFERETDSSWSRDRLTACSMDGIAPFPTDLKEVRLKEI